MRFQRTFALTAAVLLTSACTFLQPEPTEIPLAIDERSGDLVCAGVALLGATIEWDATAGILELVRLDGERQMAVFPAGYTGRLEDGAVEVVTPDGRVWLREGVTYDGLGACPLGGGRVLLGRDGPGARARDEDADGS